MLFLRSEEGGVWSGEMFLHLDYFLFIPKEDENNKNGRKLIFSDYLDIYACFRDLNQSEPKKNSRFSLFIYLIIYIFAARFE